MMSIGYSKYCAILYEELEHRKILVFEGREGENQTES
jgi:hypothetical protein